MSLEVDRHICNSGFLMLTLRQARDAVDPLSALRFWSDEAQGHLEVQNYVSNPSPSDFLILIPNKVNRFARRSRALHRLEILSDDISSLASLSVASSSASTISGSTITARTPPSPPSFHSRTQSQPQNPNPFSNPPSYRSAPSVEASSILSTSTLSSHLANQRRPTQVPPLISTVGTNQGTGALNSISRVGADGRNRLARASAVSLPAQTGVAAVSAGESQVGSQAGSQAGSGRRRLSRRASFFFMLRNVGIDLPRES